MKTKLLRLLAWACMLLLAMGLLATASATNTEVAHVIVLKWEDENNVERIRPSSVTCVLGSNNGISVSASEGWASVDDGPEGATWTVPAAPTGYTAAVGTEADGVTVVTLTHTVERTSITATAVWNDDDDANGVRPSTVLVQLLANGANYGPPKELSSGSGWQATWDDVLVNKNGSALSYTVKAADVPEFYSVTNGTNTVTYTLQTGTLKINSTLIGAPDDSGSLKIRIDGPDHRMTMNVNYSAFSGGSYTVPNVLPGAYLVTVTNAETLYGEYYVVDEQTARQDATYVKAGTTGQTTLKVTWTDTIPDRQRNENPLEKAVIDKLVFEILGPDESLPITITYADFVAGKYSLDHLKPGSYAVVERNAGTLINYYTLVNDSVTGSTFQVKADEKASVELFNHYEPSLTPPPQPDLVDIPVTKIWDDSDDADGSRPDAITVYLYADGGMIETRQLTAENNWSTTFMDLPRYRLKDVEYVYSIREEPVPMYLTSINGTTITNTYQYGKTSTSVRKLWNDQNNASRIRPTSITMTLRCNGKDIVTRVKLSDENNWYAEVKDLPTRVDGVQAVYTWTEQEVAGYTSAMSTDGTSVIFTNTPFDRPPDPPKPPRIPGRPRYKIEETAPGFVYVEINHVGDCFD